VVNPSQAANSGHLAENLTMTIARKKKPIAALPKLNNHLKKKVEIKSKV